MYIPLVIVTLQFSDKDKDDFSIRYKGPFRMTYNNAICSFVPQLHFNERPVSSVNVYALFDIYVYCITNNKTYLHE